MTIILKGLTMKKIVNYYSVLGTSLELGGIRNNPGTMSVRIQDGMQDNGVTDKMFYI